MNKDELMGTAKTIGGKVEQVAGKATGDGVTRLSGASREAEGRVQDFVGQARDMAGDAADTATDYAKDAYDKGRTAVRDGTREIKQQTGVDLNNLNWTSILLGAVIGFLLGSVVSRS